MYLQLHVVFEPFIMVGEVGHSQKLCLREMDQLVTDTNSARICLKHKCLFLPLKPRSPQEFFQLLVSGNSYRQRCQVCGLLLQVLSVSVHSSVANSGGPLSNPHHSAGSPAPFIQKKQVFLLKLAVSNCKISQIPKPALKRK